MDADEAEFMENVFDALCSALNEPQIKTLFLASEGVHLMVLMMKYDLDAPSPFPEFLILLRREKLQARSRSIKALNYAMSGPGGAATCESFVEALGLKTLFSAFMDKVSDIQKA